MRDLVPQPMSYAPGAYRYPGVFPPTDIAPAWHQYNGMMRRYEVPPHYQQYPQSDHVALHTDHHPHVGGSNHCQMTRHRDNSSMQPQMYSAHATHANHGTFSREYHQNYQGGNHLLQNPSDPSHCILLATAEDTNWLSEFLCFVRSHCIETFCASHHDVSSRLGCKQVNLGQVGIRCRYCAHCSPRRRVRRSSTFPSSLCRIYQSLTMMLRDHFLKCPFMPQEDKEAYIRLRSSISEGIVGSKSYWVLSAKGLGLTDTPDGIFFKDERHATGTK
mmetsp:Transcript_10076/g.14973  ORF Transcript_10076/g.14973 Transcript_10076/m.14973 type:complete len:274 (-) Transcript_10076:162-983(-)